MAAGGYDGSVRIKAVLDNKGFNKGVSSMESSLIKFSSTLKKLGSLIGVAFGVATIAQFSKAALDAASDLQEVQNVVDVAFGDMAYKAEEFAATSIEKFGMSEATAKRAASTYMAMGKSMGLTMNAASDMAVAVAKLTGDVASYFNISQDLVSVKLTGIWTGETEALKDLGVVMTEANLEQYALAQGIQKSYRNMSQAEKVTLRYQFVMASLADAQGDFAHTSDSYANQTRILAERFNQLKIAVGNALLPIAQAVLPSINAVIAGLTKLANVFAQVVALIFGKKAGTSETDNQAQTYEQIAAGGNAAADATEGLADATVGAGTAAKKAEKDMKGVLAGFDDLNILADNTAKSLGNAADGLDGGTLSMPEIGSGGTLFEGTNIDPDLENGLQHLIDRANELKGILEKGFEFGFGNSGEAISGLIDGLQNIGIHLNNIFTDEQVQTAAQRFVDSFVFAIGSLAGSFASVGTTIITALVGGFEQYLSENSGRIKEWLIRIFEVGEEISTIISEFSSAFADVFSVFSGESAQSIIASVIQIFSDIFGGVIEVGLKFGRDILDTITAPFIENKDLLKETLEGFLQPVSEVVGSIADIVRTTVDGIVALYDEHIHPFIMSVKEGFTEWYQHLLDGWNQYINPVLSNFAEKFDDVVQQHVKPMIDKAIEFLGKLFDNLKKVWDEVLQPLVTWIIDNAMPVVGEALNGIGEAFNLALATISDVASGILESLGGVLDFVTGVFTGDFELAVQGIGEIFSGLEKTFNSVIELVEGAFDSFLGWLDKNTNGKFHDTIEAIRLTIDELAGNIETIIGGITEFLTGVFSRDWSRAWDGIKETFSGVWNGIVGLLESAVNAIISGINWLIDQLNKISFSVPDWVPEWAGGGKTFGININKVSEVRLPRLANGAVIPPNHQFAAILGDQRSGMNIEAPLAVIEKALENVLTRTGGGTNSDIVINVTTTLDGTVLARNQVRHINRMTQALGRPVIQF